MARTATTRKIEDVTTDDLAEQINVLRSDLGALTDLITGLGKNKAETLKTAAKEKADEAQVVAAQQAEALKVQAADLNAQANDFIKERPATALGIAAGLGFLLGYMGSRR